MEKIKEILESLRTDPKAVELLAAAEKPKNEEEIVALYTDIAGKLGFDVTADEIKEGISALEAARAAATDKAVEELDTEELDDVAGGKDFERKDPKCKSSFKQKENCWFNDGCDQVTNDYPNYVCHYNEHGWEVV